MTPHPPKTKPKSSRVRSPASGRPVAGPSVPPVEPASPDEWFDRSSIAHDAMVIIEDVTEEDWWRYAPEGRVCEFFNGTVYMPSPASNEHQDEVGFWFELLSGYRRAKMGREWVVRLGPGVLRLGPRRYPEPDVFVLPRGEPEPGQPPARLVVEVLSKSTKKHDLVRKAKEYRRAGIPEFLYIDQKNRRLIIHRKRGKAFATETIDKGVWESIALPGFWIELDWLWQEELPDPRTCLDRILAGPPDRDAP